MKYLVVRSSEECTWHDTSNPITAIAERQRATTVDVGDVFFVVSMDKVIRYDFKAEFDQVEPERGTPLATEMSPSRIKLMFVDADFARVEIDGKEYFLHTGEEVTIP